jgi:DNA-binding response OmpR family regulator
MRSGVDAVILVVEDDQAIREAVVELLILSGRTVRAAADLAEARAFLARMQPVAMVLDLHLPDGSSEELLIELARQGVSVPVILLTAAIDGEIVAKRHGAAYLRKPFAADELIELTDQLVLMSTARSASG